MSETPESPLYKDRRVMALVAIAVLAILWAILAHNSAGNQRERSAALEEQLAALEGEHQELVRELNERNEAGENIEALERRLAELEEERQSAEAALRDEQEADRGEIERLEA